MNKLCQFMAASKDSHWLVLKHLLKYLNGTMSYGLKFIKLEGLDLVVYYNVDYASYFMIDIAYVIFVCSLEGV